MWPNQQETADLVKFTEEILNGKLHFLCCVFTVILIEVNVTRSLGEEYIYWCSSASCSDELYCICRKILCRPASLVKKTRLLFFWKFSEICYWIGAFRNISPVAIRCKLNVHKRHIWNKWSYEGLTNSQFLCCDLRVKLVYSVYSHSLCSQKILKVQ